MTIADRAAAYAAAFPHLPGSHFWIVQEKGRQVLYARWLLRQRRNRRRGYHGEYPHGFVGRVMACFPDVGRDVLHAFSGSLPPGEYDRCDLRQPSEFRGDILEVCRSPGAKGRWQLIVADPPYTPADAKKYQTPMIARAAVMRAFARVVPIGGHVVWLDLQWPMHRLSEWRTVARIAVTISTNRQTRELTFFERARR